MPGPRKWDHAIELKEGFTSKPAKVYQLSNAERIAMNKFIDENLEKGYIRPSKSPMASSFFFVPKKDGKLRPCQDYQYLNKWTKKNSYPLLLISTLVDKLKDAKFFTKMDICWGYNNVCIHEGDQEKAAFIMERGLFELTVMFFGLCNSPATFQAMMDDIFQDMTHKGFIIIYMDNILIFARDRKDLCRFTQRVLQRL